MASDDMNKGMKYLEQLIQDRFNTVFQMLETLNTRFQSLSQESSEMYSILEELVDSVGAIKTSSRKTQTFVRRISQNLNGPNDISRLSRLKNSLYGSMESVRTHSPASRESDTDDSSHDPPPRGKYRDRSKKPRQNPPNPNAPRRSAPLGTLYHRPTSPIIPKDKEQERRIRNNVNENPTNKSVPSEPGPPIVFEPPPDVKPKEVAPPSQSVPIVEPPLDDPKGVAPPLATPVDYQSPESFLQSINVQIQDPNLMSALRSVFNDTPTHPQFPTGLYTVLLIDVSTSINKDMFKEVENFIGQMVDEVETSASDHNLEEMMSILTFGGRCEVIQHFTNDYMPIKDALQEKVKLGGKTPMLFGLAMAVAYCHKFGKRVKINGHIVNQRILMITDGYPTDSHDKDACQGTDYETNGIKVQSEVFKFLPILERSPITVSCIGVGECNQVFLKDIAERGHGHFYSMSNTQNALKLGRFYLYQDPVTRARTAISQDNGRSDPKTIVLQHTTATHLTDTDRAEILQLLKIDNDSRNPFPAQKNIIQPEPDPLPTPKPAPNVSENPIVQPLPPVSEIPKEKDPPPNIPPPKVSVKTDPLLPKKGEESLVPSSPDVSVSESDGELFESYGAPHNRCFPWGTRVIRGENWKWPDDQNMPGTVVAHKSEGVVVVKWDCGSHGEYPQENLFRINDPRVLKHGEVIDVGCLVKRGPNWNRGDEDGGPETTGTVIRKHRNNKVSVIWPIGIVDRYSYGEGNKELEVLDSGSAAAAPPSFVGVPRGMDPIEPDSREPMDGEEVVWQWIDCETEEFHTFSKDEKDKLEDIYKKKTGTVLVGYKGQQLRCQPAQWKYRDYTVKSRTGKLHRRVCTHDEAQTFYLIEAL